MLKLKESLAWLGRKLEAFDRALDYDQFTALGLRVERLEQDSRSQRGQLTALSQEVKALRNPS